MPREVQTFHMTSTEAIAYHRPNNENNFITFQLPYNLSYSKDVYVKVESMQIPASWYAIDSDNDTLNITVNASNYTITFNHGNYDLYEIANFLNTSMSSYNTTVTYNESTNKLTFTYTGIGTLSLLNTSTCFTLLGFISGTTYTGTTLTSVNVCDITRVMRLMVVTPSFQVNNFTSNRVPYAGLLAGIPINNIFNSIIDYRGTNEMYTPNKEFFQITIQLLDENMNAIDLNGANWTLSLSFITYD